MTHAHNELFLNGVLLRREAVAYGIDDRALHRAVRCQVLARIRQGVYCDYGTWRDANPVRRQRLLAAGVLRLYDDSVTLSHDSAALSHGGPTYGLNLGCVHLTHEGANGRTQGLVHHHRGRRLPDDIERPDGTFVTSPARTAVETTIRTRSIQTGVCLLSDFLHRELVTWPQVRAAMSLVEDYPGSLILRTVVALSDERHESVAESRCRVALYGKGLPPLLPQYEVREPWGALVGKADFAIPELGIWLEVDGKEKYLRYRRPGESLEDYLVRERRRENRMREITGWDVVRITWADLADPDRLVARIRAVARRRRA